MGEPRKFKSKPVEIEAMHITPKSLDAQMQAYLWAEKHVGSFDPMPVIEKRAPAPLRGVSIDPRDGRFIIATTGGLQWADDGDWLVKGPKGGFHACKPHVFKRKYEAAE